jgi:hypothetical protein
MSKEMQEALRKWDFYQIAKLTSTQCAEKGEK